MINFKSILVFHKPPEGGLGPLPVIEHGQVDHVGQLVPRVGQPLPIIPHIEPNRLEPLGQSALAGNLGTIDTVSGHGAGSSVADVLDEGGKVVKTVVHCADVTGRKLES